MNCEFDVIICGSGLGGSIAAAILAANGAKVAVIENSIHPRFAIGESLVPETSLRLKLLASRFGVPEIADLASFHHLRDKVSPACGVKRSFAFAYHEKGKPHQGRHSNELPTLTPPFGPDAHLLRQDTDQWVMHVAARYGAKIYQNTAIDALDISDRGVSITTKDGTSLSSKFFIDAAGRGSPVARQLGLRHAQPIHRTHTRGMFTHMVGVAPYDLVGPNRLEHGMPVPFSQSTLHHMFDGGWIWVIPFDNHRDTTSSICSVGLILDCQKNPADDLDPEEEFRSVIARYPSIAKQFENADAIRPWVGGARVQYSSSRVVGDRYALLPHSVGFIDPLYSSGLSITTLAMNALMSRLLPMIERNRFSREELLPVEECTFAAFEHYDEIVSRSFDSLKTYDSWNAWNRIWAVGNYLGTWGPLKLLAEYQITKNKALLKQLDSPQLSGLLASQHPEYISIRNQAAACIDSAKEKGNSYDLAAASIFSVIAKQNYLPTYVRFGDPEKRAPSNFTMLAGLKHILWYRFIAPTKWRTYHAINPWHYNKLVFRFVAYQFRHNLTRFWQSVRDIFVTYNSDWKQLEEQRHV